MGAGGEVGIRADKGRRGSALNLISPHKLMKGSGAQSGGGGMRGETTRGYNNVIITAFSDNAISYIFNQI